MPKNTKTNANNNSAAKQLRASIKKELKKDYVPSQDLIGLVKEKREKRDKTINDYLMCLLDPWNHPGAKIPDWVTMPSTTIKLKQRWDVTTNPSGEFVCLVFPWHNSTILSNGLGGGSNYNWTSATWTQFAKNSSVQSTCSMARPVAMGVRISYTGPVLSAAGTIAFGLYDPMTTMPAAYANILEAPEYAEFSVTAETASVDALWKPLSTANTSEYRPVAQYFVPQGAVHAWFPTGAAANTQLATQGSWFYTPAGTGLRMADCAVPSLVLGCKGLPTSLTCLRIEIVVHLEATLQSQTMTVGLYPPKSSSPVDPQRYVQAHHVMERLPVAHPTRDKPSFVEQVTSAVESIGGVVHRGAKIAESVLPLLALAA